MRFAAQSHQYSKYIKKSLFPALGIMENKGYGLYRQGSCGWTSTRNEEFQEEDIWGVFRETKDNSNSSFMNYTYNNDKEPSLVSKHLPIKIPNSQEPKIIQQSAPINIPDWSKIYGKKSWVEEEEEEEDGEGDMIPPHEWIAKSQKCSFSVCEGAGRTLKGRDLSRVRNAVLNKTGFLESKPNYY